MCIEKIIIFTNDKMSYGYYSLNNLNTGIGSGSSLTVSAQTPLIVNQTLTEANIRLFESPLNTINFNTYGKSLHAKNIIVNDTLTAPSGAFTSLRTTSITGTTAYFDTYLNLPNDPFNIPSTRVLFSATGQATGSPNFTFANNTLSIQSITGSSAHINTVNVQSLTGTTAYFDTYLNLPNDPFNIPSTRVLFSATGQATGSPNFTFANNTLSIQSITGSSARINTVNVQSLTGTTCYFDTYLNLPSDPVIPANEIYFSNGVSLTGSSKFTYGNPENTLSFDTAGIISGINQITFDQDDYNIENSDGLLNIGYLTLIGMDVFTIPLLTLDQTGTTTTYNNIRPFEPNTLAIGFTGAAFDTGHINTIYSRSISATGIQCESITGTNASFEYINFNSREYLLYTQNFGTSYTWNANTNLPFNVPINSNVNWSSTGSYYVVPRTGFYNVMAQLQVLFLPTTAGKASIMLNNTTPLTNHYLITTDLTISMSIIYPFVIGDTISIRHTSTPSVTLSTVSNDCLINITEL